MNVLDRELALVPDFDGLDEADMLLVRRAMNAAKKRVLRLVVFTSDSDNLILMAHFYQLLHQEGLQEL